MADKVDDEQKGEGRCKAMEESDTERSFGMIKPIDDRDITDSLGPGETMDKIDSTDILGMNRPVDESESTDAAKPGETCDEDDVLDEELEMMIGYPNSNPCAESSTSPSSSKEIGEAKSQDPMGQGSIYLQMLKDSVSDDTPLEEVFELAKKFSKMESEAMSWEDRAAIYPWMRKWGPPGPGVPAHEAKEYLHEYLRKMNESDCESEDVPSLPENDNLKTLREN